MVTASKEVTSASRQAEEGTLTSMHLAIPALMDGSSHVHDDVSVPVEMISCVRRRTRSVCATIRERSRSATSVALTPSNRRRPASRLDVPVSAGRTGPTTTRADWVSSWARSNGPHMQ